MSFIKKAKDWLTGTPKSIVELPNMGTAVKAGHAEIATRQIGEAEVRHKVGAPFDQTLSQLMDQLNREALDSCGITREQAYRMGLLDEEPSSKEIGLMPFLDLLTEEQKERAMANYSIRLADDLITRPVMKSPEEIAQMRETIARIKEMMKGRSSAFMTRSDTLLDGEVKYKEISPSEYFQKNFPRVEAVFVQVIDDKEIDSGINMFTADIIAQGNLSRGTEKTTGIMVRKGRGDERPKFIPYDLGGEDFQERQRLLDGLSDSDINKNSMVRAILDAPREILGISSELDGKESRSASKSMLTPGDADGCMDRLEQHFRDRKQALLDKHREANPEATCEYFMEPREDGPLIGGIGSAHVGESIDMGAGKLEMKNEFSIASKGESPVVGLIGSARRLPHGTIMLDLMKQSMEVAGVGSHKYHPNYDLAMQLHADLDYGRHIDKFHYVPGVRAGRIKMAELTKSQRRKMSPRRIKKYME